MVTKKDIEDALVNEIATILGLDEGAVSPDSSLESLGIDSIRLIELLIFIEKEYGIRLMESGLDARSLQDAASLAEAIKNAMKK